MTRLVYSKAELLRIRENPICKKKPEDLPVLPQILNQGKMHFFGVQQSCKPPLKPETRFDDNDPAAAGMLLVG
ncbi:Uncharacterised protein [Legionella adelaidensis]|uniref:Uncharacterized protein n=1 Tax=Legionella adelaidensis TaxID=45056 RepID=A0A0W0R6C3_9GAMM|nr:hypothetical protein [Legionella adelaidensis]KTC66632.1 hypothetical protein Lade_1290 [Legionella adelaidensis]VEH81029.1 Uncharacterised protein [Legionella adelaidensis]